jgi:hypothetical protein
MAFFIVTAVKISNLTIEELLDAYFSMRSMSYGGEACDYFFPELLIYTVRFVQTWSPPSCFLCDPIQPKAKCDAGKANWVYEDKPSRKTIEWCGANWIPLLLEGRPQVRPLIRAGCTARLNSAARSPAPCPLPISFNAKIYYKLL